MQRAFDSRPPEPSEPAPYPSQDFLNGQKQGGQASMRQFGDPMVGADPAGNDYGFGPQQMTDRPQFASPFTDDSVKFLGHDGQHDIYQDSQGGQYKVDGGGNVYDGEGKLFASNE